MRTVGCIIGAILVFVVLAVLIGMLCGYLVSLRRWNHGKCPNCGTPWVYWGTNSYGDRLYYCPNCHESRTIVFDVDDEEEGGEPC